ncbi:hypothetical protein QAD02_007122 [Eretmocerus hayati]|uniref:Uncharacterized protein n=1 Tax=Eretmocerus hayati TaxID=131215 RepID=A0ACC2N734_9HYME|nr:hypothetical protein QAD02_007122 [Eretmocerus hayati]
MAEQLSRFLNDNGLPREVVLSEDATRVTGKLEYDTRTDECVGRALPFDDNSMPIPGSFPCATVSQIENHFKHQDTSKLLYVYMAQPVARDAPSFCVGLFGTDNEFDSIDSLKRMVHLHNLMKIHGIKVLAHGSDGDPRLLSSDKILSGLGQNTASQCIHTINGVTVAFPEIHGDLHSEITPMQDPPHMGTKMRNCFAKDSYPVAMGKYTAAVSDLEYLMQVESKDKHKVVPSDIDPTDCMNFKSVLKICSNECIRGLEKHVPGSDATRMYLTCMKNILQAALEKDLSIEERIYKMFNPLYYLRYWREWLEESEVHEATLNFITQNTYECIELNAQGLLETVLGCLEAGSFESFLPWLMGSQPCESLFRVFRSQGTVHSMIVNFTVLDSLYKLCKMRKQQSIMGFNFAAEGIKITFPRNKFLHASFECHDFRDKRLNNETAGQLTLAGIRAIMDEAKADAFDSARRSEMDVLFEAGNRSFVSKIKLNPTERTRIAAHRPSKDFLDKTFGHGIEN